MLTRNKKNVRLEVRISEDLYQRLKQQSEKEKRSVGEVVREAVNTYIANDANQQKEKLMIVERLKSMNLPVSDWYAMEQEIIEGYLEDGPNNV